MSRTPQVGRWLNFVSFCFLPKSNKCLSKKPYYATLYSLCELNYFENCCFYCFYLSDAGLVKLSELKGSSHTGKGSKEVAGVVPDSLMTQREHFQPQHSAVPGGADEAEGAQALRRRPRKTGGGAGEDKTKGRRQMDFDPTATEEDSEEEQQQQSPPAPLQPTPKEKASAADDVWTQNQQKLLELALQQYPRGTTERWDRIAKVVPGKSKVRDPTIPQFGCQQNFLALCQCY